MVTEVYVIDQFMKTKKEKKRRKKPSKFFYYSVFKLWGVCISTETLNHRIIEQSGLKGTSKDHLVQSLIIVIFNILPNRNCN